jgi:hypothetical protein
MKTWWMSLCALTLCVPVAQTDEKNQFEEFVKLAAPGAEHRKLEPMAGSWTWAGKFWMKPDEKPMESKGTAERAWVLGGRFLRDSIESKGGPFGDFHGIGYTGYDKLRGKYTGTWMDSMCTQISPSLGTVDKTGKVFTFDRENIDPMSKELVKGKDVIRILSDDEHVMEMYKMLPDNKEFKVMEI